MMIHGLLNILIVLKFNIHGGKNEKFLRRILMKANNAIPLFIKILSDYKSPT